MDLSIIIVTWNNAEEIGPCLRSIFSRTDNLKIEVIIIDNGSTDGTPRTIDEVLRSNSVIPVKTIWNDKNTGFAAAVNRGLAASSGDYLLLLNSDTQLTDNCLQKMIERLRRDPTIGVAGGQVLNLDGTIQPSVRQFPALWDQLIILTKLYRFFPKLVAKYFCAGFDYAHEQEVDQVRGAYFWISRDLMKKIGKLDAKNFFLWFEEVDYCYLAKAAGFKVVYAPTSVALHKGGASFNQEPSLMKQRWLNRSMRNYFKKRRKYFSWVIISLVSPVSLLLAWLTQTFKIKPKNYA